jgi:4-amino-4-deoxychorismate lyase
LKIIVTRGSGGRGYKQPDPIQPTRVLSLHPFPEYPPRYWTDGISARVCQTRLGANPALAGIKHLNRLEQIIARAEWQDNQIQEGLMLCADGFVIEGTMSNVFLIKDRKLYTPDLSQAGIAGIIRGLVLSCGHGINTTVTRITIDDLLNADELFVCNSVIGIWPVRLMENRPIPVGPITLQLQAWLHGLQDENAHAEN